MAFHRSWKWNWSFCVTPLKLDFYESLLGLYSVPILYKMARGNMLLKRESRNSFKVLVTCAWSRYEQGSGLLCAIGTVRHLLLNLSERYSIKIAWQEPEVEKKSQEWNKPSCQTSLKRRMIRCEHISFPNSRGLQINKKIKIKTAGGKKSKKKKNIFYCWCL